MSIWDDGIHNAFIESTTLENKDRGVLMFSLMLNYGGTAQGFGQYMLDEPNKERKIGGERQPHIICGVAIMKILAVTDAESWEKIPGCYVRADIQNGLAKGIIHILNDEITFYPERDFAPYVEKNKQ